MVADIADGHELATGKRQEGIFFAAVSFANKTTTGLGSLIGGVGLDLIDCFACYRISPRGKATSRWYVSLQRDASKMKNTDDPAPGLATANSS